MTALISVYKNDTDRVAFYIQDCNSMGIEVLPPNINKSCWDFSIEDSEKEEGKSCIRFGLGAIKNVGSGPVDAIIEAREDGPFEDLTDLANRVDLRKVGKRALESMIKVGGLDVFGPRMALMQVMDKAISISGSAFHAAEMGQMSFFGTDSGLVQKISLPDVDPDYNRREQLRWERELVGLYVSDHPLRETAAQLKGIVTHFSNQLAQVDQGNFVRVFGEVVSIRHHQTKKGDPMAFVSIEDVGGVIRLVLFPRTWKRLSGRLQYGKVVIVEGKIDNGRGDPNILVDDIKEDLMIDPARFEMEQSEAVNAPPEAPQQPVVEDVTPEAEPTPQPEPEIIAEQPPEYQSEETEVPWDDDVPPPPENFTDDWGELNGVSSQTAPVTSKPVPDVEMPVQAAPEEVSEPAEVEEPTLDDEAAEVQEPDPEEPAPIAPAQVAPAAQPKADEEAKIDIPPVPPRQPQKAEVPEGVDKAGAPQMVTIVLRSTGDKDRDILRMRRIYGILISSPGNDRFAFYMIERNRGYRLEFPSDSTEFNSGLRATLEEIVGVGNVIVEPITYL
jgi:DNA polymerase-3 subunit alpha